MMTEVEKISFTAALTILGGLVVFTVSQLVQRLCLDPLSEQAKVIGRIAFSLTYYAHCYGSPGNVNDVLAAEASVALRHCAGELCATSNALRCYRIVTVLGLCPGKNDLRRVISILIGLSNSIGSGDGIQN